MTSDSPGGTSFAPVSHTMRASISAITARARAAVGQVTAQERAEHRTGQIERSERADLARGETERARVLQDPAHGALERHFEAVDGPRGAEGKDDQPVKTAPRQPIEPRGDVRSEWRRPRRGVVRSIGFDHDCLSGERSGRARRRNQPSSRLVVASDATAIMRRSRSMRMMTNSNMLNTKIARAPAAMPK